MSVRASCVLIVTLLAAAGCASTPSAPSSGSGQGSGQGGGAGQPAQPATTGTAGTAATAGAGAASTAGAGATATPAAAGSANGPGQTSDERRAAIDKRLNDSLGAFDAELRQEQQTLAKERDARQAAAAGTAATEAQNGEKNGEGAGSTATEGPPAAGDGKGSEDGKHPGPGRRRDHSGDLKSEKAGKKPDDNAGNGATAREIPDGSDDDVVARRLRQAAQQETDPELKEKLWQEYLDYKKNAQGKGA